MGKDDVLGVRLMVLLQWDQKSEVVVVVVVEIEVVEAGQTADWNGSELDARPLR